MRRYMFVCLNILALMTMPDAHAAPLSVSKEALATFFGVDAARIGTECPQDSVSLQGQGDDAELEICLNRADRQRRCEVTIADLPRDDRELHVSYDIKLADAASYPQWFSLMQIHSFPDQGEAWRCPPLSFEVMNGHMRMFNRWDAQLLSQTTGYHCTETGSSITSRTVLENIPVTSGAWMPVTLSGLLSYHDKGHIEAMVGSDKSEPLLGANTYNDSRDPFLKFGIYKPTSWEDGHTKICVSYRRVRLETKP